MFFLMIFLNNVPVLLYRPILNSKRFKYYQKKLSQLTFKSYLMTYLDIFLKVSKGNIKDYEPNYVDI